jgi:exosortase/archaeosortase
MIRSFLSRTLVISFPNSNRIFLSCSSIALEGTGKSDSGRFAFFIKTILCKILHKLKRCPTIQEVLSMSVLQLTSENKKASHFCEAFADLKPFSKSNPVSLSISAFAFANALILLVYLFRLFFISHLSLYTQLFGSNCFGTANQAIEIYTG